MIGKKTERKTETYIETDAQGEIEHRAYEIWLAEGRPHGRSLEHWVQAERDVMLTTTDVRRPTKGK